MSLNSYLCKHFDKDNKKYVTIEDVVHPLSKSIIVIVFLSMIFLWVGIVSSVWQGYITPKYPVTISDLFSVIIKGWILPIEIISVIILILIIVNSLRKLFKKILQIKIAKCPLKEQDDR